jgi:Ca2+-binding EF-hand superfamily protein
MRIIPVVVAVFALAGSSYGEEPKPPATANFFERLDTNSDGKVSIAEAPEQGKMLVEFLLRQSGKKNTDQLDRVDFMRLTASPVYRPTDGKTQEKAVAAAIGAGDVQTAPENCPACAMGLTAEFVFKRLDVDEDKLVTVAEFMRSPGMQDMSKAREVVGRLDKSGDEKLSWKELEAAYKARHAKCKQPDPATIAANGAQARPDGRGDGNRFAQVFILRSDQDGDGKISKKEFRGPSFGFDRMDKNKNGFIEADELGELHQRRLNDPKSMRERLQSGDVPTPPQGKRPEGLGDADPKKQ